MPEEEEESLHLPGAVSTDGPAKKSGSKKKSGTPTKTKSKKKGKGRNEEEGGGHAGEDEGGPILPGSAMPSPGKLAPIELKRKKVPDEGLLTGGSIRETALDEAGSAVANGRGDPGAHQAQAVVGDISNRGGDAEHETAEKSVDPAPPLPPSAQNNQAAQQQQQQHNQHNQQGALDFDLEAAGVTMEKDDFEGFHQKSRPSFFTTAKTIVGMGLGKRRGSASNVVSADQSRRDGKSIPSSDNEIRSWARRPSAQSGFTATDNEGSMSTSGLARRRWKKAGNVIAALNATSGDRTKIDQETMMTLLSGNMARRMGEHAFKTRLIEMTGDEIDKLLANVTIEGFIRQIMEEFAEQQRRKKSKVFENLFLSIDKDGGGTVNVAGELGETLIRLGIDIKVQVMHEAVATVCLKRGREPDDYYGTGVSIKIPVFNELEVDEFVEVMFVLTDTAESDTQKIIASRTVFSAIDTDRDGRITLDEFFAMLDGKNVEYDRDAMADQFRKVANESDGELNFRRFLELQGLEASDDDYASAELEGRRQTLKDAITTFMTFDVDGGGTIDITEIGTVMRAMGRRVTEEELEAMMAVADVAGKGEIDFEQFCTHILNMKESTFHSLIDAHKIEPVMVPHVNSMRHQHLSIKDLAPNAWARSNMSPEDRLAHDLLAKNDDLKGRSTIVHDFYWEDFGQHGVRTSKLPTLDTTSSSYNSQFAKFAKSRPFTLTAHKDNCKITMARFFPQGDRLALTSSDGTIRIFDLTRPRSKQICNIIAHDHHALCLAISPDGSRVVTGGADWAVSMWMTDDLDHVATQFMHSGYVRYLDWSLDGTMIASCGSDMTVCLWDAGTFTPIHQAPALGHTSWVRWCIFTMDCKRLITGSDDQTVMVWEVPSCHVLQTLRAHSHTVSGGCVMANNRVYTAGFDENLLLWTQDTGLLGYLKVFVIEAFDLKRGDGLTGSMSNQRFVTLELGKGQLEQTSHKKGSSPHWFEEFNLSVWDLDESVLVQVWDWDKDENHRFLGEVRIPLEELAFAEEGVTDKEFDLDDQQDDTSTKPSISLRFTFREVKCIGEVTVLVERARGLPRMDTFGLSDPFCAVSVGKSERHKTKVVKRNLNPEWNEEFVYNVEEGARELKIVLYDWSVTKEEDFIGQVAFSVDKLQENTYMDDWFPLKSIDGSSQVKGEVKLTIKFLSEDERDKGLSSLRFRRNPTTWPSSARGDFNYYAPIGQVVLFGRTILRGKCRYCGKHRNQHTNNLRCDLGKGMYVHSVDVSTDGSLVAWGTGDGRIRVSSVSTSEQISCWTAHAGPVMGLHWAKGDLRLLSYGADHRGVDYKLYTRGSYIPREGQKESLNNVVEIWYVGSMVKSAVLKKKKGEGGAKGEGDEQVAGGKDEDEDEDDEDDEDDEEEEEAGKDGGKSKVGRELRKHRRKPQGKIGYTPVYYDPPAKADGTLARSCLKGRGEKRTKKLNFDWGAIPDREDWFFYPPEEPSDEEEESEPEVKPRRRGGGDRN